MNAAWYLRRLRSMGAAEIAGRLQDQAWRAVWRYRRPDVARLAQTQLVAHAALTFELPPAQQAPVAAKERLIAAAEAILRGQWRIFNHFHGSFRDDPDWFCDSRSGKKMPSDVFAFDIKYRDEARSGNIKYIWEPSRHHHLTLLATAFALTGDDRYANRIADHLRSWWRDNEFLCGPHWISGIEIGIRLIAWAWIRRLLADWLGAPALFEHNDVFRMQLYAHQLWLARFPSRGSSANNHIIAEAAGQFVAACAFPLFRDSAQWRGAAAETLRREAVAQTFDCGSNRELATDYHGFVLELLLAAAIEGDLSNHPVDAAVWEVICKMTDVIAAMLDDAGKPPRQGDADDGIGLLLDDGGYDRWQSLLATGAKLFSPLPWWPQPRGSDMRTFFLTHGAKPHRARHARAAQRPDTFADAGQVFLRSRNGEIWCRCDHGPHGFGGIAAHAHADALSIECRAGGVEVFADPGTYCYHGDPKWRRYFRSTFGHNTLELLGRDQSTSGGPFLWMRHAQSRLVATSGLAETAALASWTAEHLGYAPDGGPVHRRAVTLTRESLTLRVEDRLIGGEAVAGRLCWHLGPSVDCALADGRATLSWPGGGGELKLPPELRWTAYRGDEVLPAGWYSPSFDRRIPSVTLVGVGRVSPAASLVTELRLQGGAAP